MGNHKIKIIRSKSNDELSNKDIDNNSSFDITNIPKVVELNIPLENNIILNNDPNDLNITIQDFEYIWDSNHDFYKTEDILFTTQKPRTLETIKNEFKAVAEYKKIKKIFGYKSKHIIAAYNYLKNLTEEELNSLYNERKNDTVIDELFTKIETELPVEFLTTADFGFQKGLTENDLEQESVFLKFLDDEETWKDYLLLEMLLSIIVQAGLGDKISKYITKKNIYNDATIDNLLDKYGFKKTGYEPILAPSKSRHEYSISNMIINFVSQSGSKAQMTGTKLNASHLKSDTTVIGLPIPVLQNAFGGSIYGVEFKNYDKVTYTEKPEFKKFKLDNYDTKAGTISFHFSKDNGIFQVNAFSLPINSMNYLFNDMTIRIGESNITELQGDFHWPSISKNKEETNNSQNLLKIKQLQLNNIKYILKEETIGIKSININGINIAINQQIGAGIKSFNTAITNLFTLLSKVSILLTDSILSSINSINSKFDSKVLEEMNTLIKDYSSNFNFEINFNSIEIQDIFHTKLGKIKTIKIGSQNSINKIALGSSNIIEYYEKKIEVIKQSTKTISIDDENKIKGYKKVIDNINELLLLDSILQNQEKNDGYDEKFKRREELKQTVNTNLIIELKNIEITGIDFFDQGTLSLKTDSLEINSIANELLSSEIDNLNIIVNKEKLSYINANISKNKNAVYAYNIILINDLLKDNPIITAGHITTDFFQNGNYKIQLTNPNFKKIKAAIARKKDNYKNNDFKNIESSNVDYKKGELNLSTEGIVEINYNNEKQELILEAEKIIAKDSNILLDNNIDLEKVLGLKDGSLELDYSENIEANTPPIKGNKKESTTNNKDKLALLNSITGNITIRIFDKQIPLIIDKNGYVDVASILNTTHSSLIQILNKSTIFQNTEIIENKLIEMISKRLPEPANLVKNLKSYFALPDIAYSFYAAIKHPLNYESLYSQSLKEAQKWKSETINSIKTYIKEPRIIFSNLKFKTVVKNGIIHIAAFSNDKEYAIFDIAQATSMNHSNSKIKLSSILDYQINKPKENSKRDISGLFTQLFIDSSKDIINKNSLEEWIKKANNHENISKIGLENEIETIFNNDISLKKAIEAIGTFGIENLKGKIKGSKDSDLIALKKATAENIRLILNSVMPWFIYETIKIIDKSNFRIDIENIHLNNKQTILESSSNIQLDKNLIPQLHLNYLRGRIDNQQIDGISLTTSNIEFKDIFINLKNYTSDNASLKIDEAIIENLKLVLKLDNKK